MSNIDLWGNFLYNEKFDMKYIDPDHIEQLLELMEKLAIIRGPKVRPHKEKLESRKLVVLTAFDLGIDLPAMKHIYNGKPIIGRGLLDVWNEQYKIVFGSNIGTASLLESRRRDIKIKLSKRISCSGQPKTEEKLI